MHCKITDIMTLPGQNSKCRCHFLSPSRHLSTSKHLEPLSAALLPCMGPCLRAFHGPCVGLQGPPAETWFCPECESGKMRCFICGEYSSGFDDPGVRKCSLGVCGRFYHTRQVVRPPRYGIPVLIMCTPTNTIYTFL